MLFALIGTHDPQTCPGSDDEIRQKALSIGPRLEGVNKEHGVTMHGTWIAQANHTTYGIVDAPSAHEAQAALIDLGLIEWNTYEIHPVITLEEGMQELAQQ